MKPIDFLFMLVLLLGASHTARAQKQLYTATIQSDGVKIDFDLEECGRYADSFLNHPARITRSAMVEGLGGRVVELLKTNIGPDWNPVLVMRTADGKVFLLNVREIMDTGDYVCGQVHGITNAKALKVVRSKGQLGTTPAAVLADGKTCPLQGSQTDSGFYAIDGYDLVVHITSDYGINLLNKEGEPLASGTWHQSWAGSGMVVMSCTFGQGNTEVEMYSDPNPTSEGLHPSFVIHKIDGLAPSSLPFGTKLRSTLMNGVLP